MLTNFAADTFVEARRALRLPEEATRGDSFRRDHASSRNGRIYDHHVQAFGLDPAATIFIDDSQKNVDGAKAAGWQAVLFTDAPTLRKDLVAWGIEL